MTRKEIIEKHGMHDGKDDVRFEQALYYSCYLDRPIISIFVGLITLERKGVISLRER
nr:hypothetical protein BdHM001_35520 [Bdellovibrio sp. HM001]